MMYVHIMFCIVIIFDDGMEYHDEFMMMVKARGKGYMENGKHTWEEEAGKNHYSFSFLYFLIKFCTVCKKINMIKIVH